MKKQTALEWLLFEMSKNGLLPNGIPNEIHNQAKEMEKKQIMDAYIVGINNMSETHKKELAEKYYNETFNSEK
jgi:hypothetical protein